MTCLGSETLFCATHIVRWTPFRLAVASTDPVGAAPALPPVASLQAVAASPRAHTAARDETALFMALSLGTRGLAELCCEGGWWLRPNGGAKLPGSYVPASRAFAPDQIGADERGFRRLVVGLQLAAQ